MQIIILGAGEVGATLAAELVREHHDITVIDQDAERLHHLQERLDIRTVTGHASYPSILRLAGGKNADMIIAVTDSDEVNMVACQVAYSVFGTATKIARIRSPHYLIRKELFNNENMPIDVFINPEHLLTRYIQQLIEHPGAQQVLDFANGKVKLVAAQPHYGAALAGRTLSEIPTLIPDAPVRTAAIDRDHQSIPLTGDTTIEVGDLVFFIAASEHIQNIIGKLRRVDEPYKKIMIAGGGNVGLCLAKALEDHYHVKVIEQSRERCELLAQTLSSATVLCGDAADAELLNNENIEHIDVFCAMTNEDEANIMACLQAKRLGARTAMALITRSAYTDLVDGSNIIAISPQHATISTILAHIRRSDIVNIHTLRHGAAEAIEVIAHGDKKSSKIIGRAIEKIKLPAGTTIGAIVRGEDVIIPHHDTLIEAGDHVIVFIGNKQHVTNIEKLFHPKKKET